MKNDPATTTISDGIAEIVLDHPPVNAFDAAGWEKLAAMIRDAGDDPATKEMPGRKSSRACSQRCRRGMGTGTSGCGRTAANLQRGSGLLVLRAVIILQTGVGFTVFRESALSALRAQVSFPV